MVANTIADQLQRASWIRRMFEEGARLKRERGPENVCDFTLGNPEVEPPEQVLAMLRRIAAEAPPGAHGYMPNAGYPEVREIIAGQLRADTGLPFTADDVLMTVGSSAACNVILKSILDPGDEVIVLMPCFSEYPFYVHNHAGRLVPVETDKTFLPDIGRIQSAITARTRAIILNTPNNPTGRIYGEEVLRDLEAMLRNVGRPIMVISDEPYKRLVFDGRVQPEVASIVTNTAIAVPGQNPRPSPASASAISPCRRSCRSSHNSEPPAFSRTAFSGSSMLRLSGSGWRPKRTRLR